MRRISYEKQQRERAKREGKGLITLDIIRSDGGRSTIQLIASSANQQLVTRIMNQLIDGKS